MISNDLLNFVKLKEKIKYFKWGEKWWTAHHIKIWHGNAFHAVSHDLPPKMANEAFCVATVDVVLH